MSTDVGAWLDRYSQAWLAKDATLAATLFAADAAYSFDPFQEPLRGRAAIGEYWRAATAPQRDVDLRFQDPVVDGARALVRWWVTLTTDDGPRTLTAALVLEFNDAGECASLEEFWTDAAEIRPAPGSYRRRG